MEETAHLNDEQHGPKTGHYAKDSPGKDAAYLFALRVGGTLIATLEERRLACIHSSLVPPCGNTNKGGRNGQTGVEDNRVENGVFLEESRLFFEDAKEPSKLDAREYIPQH